MKVKLLLVTALSLALTASAATAAPPPGKGKPLTTGDNCKPKVTVVLKGTLASVAPAALTVTVTRANRWGKAYATAGTAAVTVDADTKVRRNGKKSATDLVVGDRVLVQARVCKADLAEGAMPALTAVRVVAHPAKS